MNKMLAVVVVLLWAGGAGAVDDILTRATLKGLEGVWVLIEEPDQETIAGGLTREQLETDTELRLRKVGIKVLTFDEAARTPGRPRLYVNVTTIKSDGGFYVYYGSVALIQSALLERNQNIQTLMAETWSTGSVGIVGESGMAQGVRGRVGDFVDEFINAYLSVNPITPQR